MFQKYYSERMERKLLLKSMFCLGVVTTQWLHFLRIIEERHLEKMFEILEMMFCHFSRPQALPFPFVIFIATHQIESRSYISSVLNKNSIFYFYHHALTANKRKIQRCKNFVWKPKFFPAVVVGVTVFYFFFFQ